MDRETAQAVIETDAGPISVWEFGHFLYLFRAAYAAASPRVMEAGLNQYSQPQDFERFAESLREELRTLGDNDVTALAKKELPLDLGMLNIARHNPIDILFEGIPGAIAIAIILSGGSIRVGPFRAKLPPLGTGIAALRDAFGKKQLPSKRKK